MSSPLQRNDNYSPPSHEHLNSYLYHSSLLSESFDGFCLFNMLLLVINEMNYWICITMLLPLSCWCYFLSSLILSTSPASLLLIPSPLSTFCLYLCSSSSLLLTIMLFLCRWVFSLCLSLSTQTGHLAMETLLSLTSKRAGDWFKEELRLLGGLDHIVDKGSWHWPHSMTL